MRKCLKAIVFHVVPVDGTKSSGVSRSLVMRIDELISKDYDGFVAIPFCVGLILVIGGKDVHGSGRIPGTGSYAFRIIP